MLKQQKMNPSPLEVSINYTHDQHIPSFDMQSFTREILSMKGVKKQVVVTSQSYQNDEIHSMNKTYLNHDYPTDVYQFSPE